MNGLRSALLNRIDLSTIAENIWKRSSALNTWGTNAIEGSTINWKEAQSILLDQRTPANRPVRDVLETIQHDAAFRGLPERKRYPIDLVTVLELHEGVFRGVLPDAGNWRKVNVRIQGANFTPPRMEKVIPMMEELLKEYQRRDTEGEDVFELGAWFHFTFESIHPFQDGNGRVGRLLLNLHFLKHNWPPIHILPNDRDGYIRALETGHEGDLGPMVSFIKRLMASSLLDLLDQVGTAEDELTGLKKASALAPYDAKYLSLRCGQGELPGVLSGHKWHTSRRAIELYMEGRGRK
ncbi:MAG: Fic family protein [Thermoplasmatota archaeon]